MELKNSVKVGDAINPWIFVGPLLLTDSQKVFDVLFSEPYEGVRVRLDGREYTWQLLRQSSPYHMWRFRNAGKGIIAVFLSTRLISKSSSIRLKLSSLSTNRILVSFSKHLVFDSERLVNKGEGRILESVIAMEGEREGILNVALLLDRRGGVTSHLGFSLVSETPDLLISIPLNPAVSEHLKMETEEEVEGVSLSKKVFVVDEPISISVERPTTFEYQILEEEKVVSEGRIEKNSGELILKGTEKLDTGRYLLRCAWKDRNKDLLLVTKEFFFFKAPKTPEGRKLSLEERKDHILKTILTHNLPRNERDRIWHQVARFYCGEEPAETEIAKACEYVNARRDCSDFVLQGILRILFLDREKKRLNEKTRDLMKECILNFKYWIGEPGEDSMYMDTENHRLLFHTAEWLAGMLFPNEIFRNSGQRGTFHYLKGRESILRWLESRGRFGFDEWHSNVYLPIVLSALLNIFDFAPPEEHELWLKAKQLLDILIIVFHQDSFEGIFGTVHGRTYENHILYPELNEVSTINWLLSGDGFVSFFEGGIGTISLCTSKYLDHLPMKVLHHLDTLEEVEARYRQGRLTMRSLSAVFSVYKTRYYMVSALTHFHKGSYFSLLREGRVLKTGALSYWSFPFPHLSFAQITLPRGTVITWSCPLADIEGYYYWFNAILPKVFHHRNILILMFRDVPWMTHCFFEKRNFDEVIEESNWIFGRVEKSYLGIFSSNGFSFAKYGLFRDNELLCHAPENVWIAVLGSERDDHSFNDFVKELSKGFYLKRLNEDDFECYIPRLGNVKFGWNRDHLMVENKEIPQSNYPLFDTPCLFSDFGSGCIKIKVPDWETEYWF